MLFIDSLDQLTNDYLARSDISFLKNIKKHPESIIIVSCLIDDKASKYFYECDTKLKQSRIPRVLISGIAAKETNLIVRSMLQHQGRTLTESQLNILNLSAQAEPSMLYLSLAVRRSRDWTSSSIDVTLDPGVARLIHQIFQHLEDSYGEVLVRTALSFLTFSKEGISDNEMIDLLTCDETVMISVNKYAASLRLPTHVWLRLRGEMNGLVVEKDGGCIMWYHRQLHETAIDRYQKELKRVSKVMGKYFGNLIPVKETSLKQISSQPLVLNGPDLKVLFPSARVNRRRCAEAAAHLCTGGLIDEAVNELCTIESVTARAKCGMIMFTVYYFRFICYVMCFIIIIKRAIIRVYLFI